MKADPKKCSPRCRDGYHSGIDCDYVRRIVEEERARLHAKYFGPSSVTGGRRCAWCGLLLPCGC